MNKKTLIKQNKDQPQCVEGRFFIFPCNVTGSMSVRGAGLASARWPFSGAIVGAITGRFRHASDTRLEASIKEKYRITALVSRLSLLLI